MNRRQFLGRLGTTLGAVSSASPLLAAGEQPSHAFAQRGYYITFMRMPTYGLNQWREIFDCIRADGGNLVLLWMGGAFRSRRFPITWKFNREHANVRSDFGRELIADAHGKGIKVLLGFTPFAYDGVNQYSIEHPELKATKKDGKPADESGIYCWGWNLCPSRAESQRFMREYVREMFFEFYPEADGLMIESSDYAICHCADCRGHFFEKEFEFVDAISSEVWAKKPSATIVLYPHYFSGTNVPGFDVAAATRPFDPRWTLFFTPHSAHVDPKLIRQARASLWWDEGPALHDATSIQRGARRAKSAGVTGYVPSLEAFTFVPTHPEEGESYLVGRRQVPFGFGWLKEDEIPFKELPMRVNRMAYRHFSREPWLPFEEFKRRLGQEIFGHATSEQAVNDLLELQQLFARERTWCQASPLVSPARLRVRKERGQLKPGQAAAYRAALDRVRDMNARYGKASNPAMKEMQRICRWILDQWTGFNAGLLRSDPTGR